MLNDSMVMDASEATARRIMAEIPEKDNDTRIDRMFEWIEGTVATNEQHNSLLGFLRQTEDRLSSGDGKDPELRAIAIACHAMFASSRFQFLE